MRDKFVLNEHLDVVLEDDGRTRVYIDGKQFIECMRLVLNIPFEDTPKYDSIDSMDEASYRNSTLYMGHGYEEIAKDIEITPEEEFAGHCSNLQAWVEHDYDTRLLDSQLAFNLLKVLVEAGDEKAKRVFIPEIESRIKCGFSPTVIMVFESTWFFLDKEMRNRLDPYVSKALQDYTNFKKQVIIKGKRFYEEEGYLIPVPDPIDTVRKKYAKPHENTITRTEKAPEIQIFRNHQHRSIKDRVELVDNEDDVDDLDIIEENWKDEQPGEGE